MSAKRGSSRRGIAECLTARYRLPPTTQMPGRIRRVLSKHSQTPQQERSPPACVFSILQGVGVHRSVDRRGGIRPDQYTHHSWAAVRNRNPLLQHRDCFLGVMVSNENEPEKPESTSVIGSFCKHSAQLVYDKPFEAILVELKRSMPAKSERGAALSGSVFNAAPIRLRRCSRHGLTSFQLFQCRDEIVIRALHVFLACCRLVVDSTVVGEYAVLVHNDHLWRVRRSIQFPDLAVGVDQHGRRVRTLLLL
jgi:hypothetical protein